MKKYVDSSWDFRNENTKQLTHCFHSYPAMMIPQIAARLIEKHGRSGGILFDPYCGTGTSIVEANVRNMNTVATDINPLARLIAKAKSTLIPIQVLDFYIKDFNEYCLNYRFGRFEVHYEIPIFPNIDFWFKEATKRELAFLKHYIIQIEDSNVHDFFMIAFSETIREVSLTKNSEFKLVRMREENIKSFSPDTIAIFANKLFRNRNGLLDFSNLVKDQRKNRILDFNTVFEIPTENIEDDSIDLIVTSPPYGDSKTTVAYGQFSRLSNQWLGFENSNQIDNLAMGGKRAVEFHKFGIEQLDEQIEKIAFKDIKRALEVVSFYDDYKSSISNISKKLTKGGKVIFVVGNRRVKDQELPTDLATCEFFESNDFSHIGTVIRNIPNKKMPRANSPTNIIGQLKSTMNFEYIVTLVKN